MKHTVAICLAAAALGALPSVPAAAEPARPRMAQEAGADAMPPYEIVTAVRSMGFTPVGRPARQGPYYVLHAVDARGVDMRVVADAQFGDILSIQPVRQPANYGAPRYDGGPRIVRVPQGFNRVMPGDDDGEPVAPTYNRGPRDDDEIPSVYERMPRGYDRRATAPPPPPPPRAVLAPPSYRSNGPSPIKPLPRPRGAVDKFLPTIDPPVTPEGEPQANANEPAPQASASVPPIPPPTPETKTLPPPEVKTPPPNKLIDMPAVAPLE